MVHYSCDMCGKPLLLDEEVRYVIKIEAYAAYDPIEISEDDLAEDHMDEIEELCESLEEADAKDMEDRIYKTFKFDLCAACHEEFLRDPLSAKFKKRLPFDQN